MSSFEESLSDAAATGNIPFLRQAFLSGKARADAVYMGIPLISTAAWNGLPDTVRFLLDAGAAANQRDSDGSTALMYAAQANDPKTIEVLMDFGADAGLKNKFNETAASYAEVRPRVAAMIAQKRNARTLAALNVIAFPRRGNWRHQGRPA